MTIRYTGHRSKGGCLDVDETALSKLAADKESLIADRDAWKAKAERLWHAGNDAVRSYFGDSDETHNAMRKLEATLKGTV